MKEDTIKNYMLNNKLDVEKMIKNFNGYIHTIVENNVGDKLSNEDKEEIVSDVFLTVWHNKEKIDIFYDERPVWIQGVNNQIAKVGFIDNFEEKDVFIDDLYERNLYN